MVMLEVAILRYPAKKMILRSVLYLPIKIAGRSPFLLDDYHIPIGSPAKTLLNRMKNPIKSH